MKHAAVKEVDRSEYLGHFAATLRENVFCSDNWQTICCREIETSEGLKVRIDLSVYPPGGPDRTAMRRCRVCGKWAPPESMTGACVDCFVESAQAAFEQRMQRLHRATGDDEFVRTITALHWKRPFIRSETPGEERARLKQKSLAAAQRRRRRSRRNGRDDEQTGDFDASAFPYDGLYEPLTESPTSVDWATFAEQHTTSGQHWLAEALDMTDRPTERHQFGEVLEALRKHLEWVARDYPRRATGCGLVILSEDEQSLREEIAEFQATGKLKPITTERGRAERYKPMDQKPKPKRRNRPKTTSARAVEVVSGVVA